jgi:putative transposase
MTAYRRDRTPGATWFFTLNLADRRTQLLTAHIDLLRASFAHVMQRHPWQIDAIVVLPDHLHALCALPPDDADFATRWRLIKTGSPARCRLASTSPIAGSTKANAAYGNGAIGNTASATKATSFATSTASTTIRASMTTSSA